RRGAVRQHISPVCAAAVSRDRAPRKARYMTAEERSVELARIAAVADGEKGGKDVVAFDVSEQLAITDIFVVGSVDNAPQMRAVTDEIEDRMREAGAKAVRRRSEEHTSELQSRFDLVCRLLLEKKKQQATIQHE